MGRVAVVLGATGIAGRELVSELQRQEWKIYGVSRKPPDFATSAQHVGVDINDQQACNDVLGKLTDTTHIFWAAYADAPKVADTRIPNARMFRNSVSAIERNANGLRHICLLQGTKYYGQHLGPFKTPAKESDPRGDFPPHYYYDQQDFLMELRQEKAWTWSAPRPHIICGFAYGTPLNAVTSLAVYATVLKELGRPLSWPGKPGAFSSVYQATDAKLLARAMIWMATEDRCANQAFNITNGDYFRYQNLWPAFARYFGMEMAPPKQVDLIEYMRGKDDVWSRLVERHRLVDVPFSRVADWNFANYAFSNDWDVMSDTSKCRRFGFYDFIDSEKMFLQLFDEFRGKRIIP